MEKSNFVRAEYIWVGGKGELRCKTKVIHGKSSVTLDDLPHWNYDGSSTAQAPGVDSEVIIIPRAIYHDPFRGGNNVLVVTDTYTPDLTPLPTNSRHLAAKIFETEKSTEPWFGVEQEYTMFQDGRPLGWPKCAARSIGGSPLNQIGYPAPQGPYYCSAGANVAFGREVAEEHLLLCMKAGLTLSGINAEVMPGQWEFQVGPCTGIDSGDMMIASRYILNRVGEKHGVHLSLDPKPVAGDWNGSGCHTNFSTKAMREEEGSLDTLIIPAIEKLGKRHAQHINVYGDGNDKRMTGQHETAGLEVFSYGIANRGASVRIPNATAQKGKGYFEDRRPASNMDPYIVTSMIYDSCVLDGKFSAEFDAVKTEGVDVVVETTEPAPIEEAKEEVDVLDKMEKEAEIAVTKEAAPEVAEPPAEAAKEEEVTTDVKETAPAEKSAPAPVNKKKKKKGGGCVAQ